MHRFSSLPRIISLTNGICGVRNGYTERTTWDDRFDWSMHPNHSIMSATLHSIFSLSFLNIDTEDLNITLMTEAEIA